MGIVGRYIDSLPDEARDRLVRGQNFTYRLYLSETGQRCVVFMAQDWDTVGYGTRMMSGEEDQVATKYDKLCNRFGQDRIVRAIKKRAGADLSELESEETATTERVLWLRKRIGTFDVW